MTNLSPFSISPQPSTDSALATMALPVPTASAAVPAAPANKPKQKPRKRINTAEKRHQHNAVERQRRETLNTKFIDLARLLPSLAAHRRPSKSAIVNGSISHLNYQRNQRLLAAKLLRNLAAEREALLGEVNEWRKASGFAPRDAAPAWTDEMEEVCNVEKETFGTFQNVGGDDGDDDDNEGSTDNYMLPSQPSFAASMHNGMITPRPSTDIDSLTQAQALFGNMPLPAARCSTASSLGPNWASEFAYSVTNTQNPSNVFPFNPFMSESVDQSVSDSPATSTHGTAITPPTFTDMMQHTPSPRSSNGMPVSMEDVKPIVMQQQAAQQTWTPAQLLAAHQQVLLHRQQQQQQQQHAQAFVAPFTPPVSNVDPNVFTQQLLATMLANGNMSNVPSAPEQIDQWRRAALGSGPAPQSRGNSTSLHDIRNAVRLGMDMASWATGSERAVEGF